MKTTKNETSSIDRILRDLINERIDIVEKYKGNMDKIFQELLLENKKAR